MAITPLPNEDKKFTFDGEKSTTYGVMILGEGAFNAPERDAEMISIPGRNGAYILDNGRFENIEVTYPCTLIADNTTDFADAISDFRNWLCSKTTYCRLVDDYNPNEYRMATYKSGLEIEPMVLQGGEFTITFECKPQRYLTSGESAVSVTSGDTITNPTRFDASPLIAVEGYGSMDVNGYDVDIENETVGHVELLPAVTNAGTGGRDYTALAKLVDNGDTMTLASFSLTVQVRTTRSGTLTTSVSRSDTNIPNYVDVEMTTISAKGVNYTFSYGEQTFTKANNNTTTYTDTVNITTNGSGTASFKIAITNKNSTSWSSLTVGIKDKQTTGVLTVGFNQTSSAFTAESTQSVLGSPTYIDCDIGEAYKLIDNEPVSLNGYIDLGSELPVLSPGNNTITYDNTFTDFDVTPRWWKV